MSDQQPQSFEPLQTALFRIWLADEDADMAGGGNGNSGGSGDSDGDGSHHL